MASGAERVGDGAHVAGRRVGDAESLDEPVGEEGMADQYSWTSSEPLPPPWSWSCPPWPPPVAPISTKDVAPASAPEEESSADASRAAVAEPIRLRSRGLSMAERKLGDRRHQERAQVHSNTTKKNMPAYIREQKGMTFAASRK